MVLDSLRRLLLVQADVPTKVDRFGVEAVLTCLRLFDPRICITGGSGPGSGKHLPGTSRTFHQTVADRRRRWRPGTFAHHQLEGAELPSRLSCRRRSYRAMTTLGEQSRLRLEDKQ